MIYHMHQYELIRNTGHPSKDNQESLLDHGRSWNEEDNKNVAALG